MPAALDPRLQLVVDRASARLRDASPWVEDARRSWALTTAVADRPDEGVDYAKRLCRAGVAVAHIHEPAMLQGFTQLGAITPGAARVTDAFCGHLRCDVAA